MDVQGEKGEAECWIAYYYGKKRGQGVWDAESYDGQLMFHFVIPSWLGDFGDTPHEAFLTSNFTLRESGKDGQTRTSIASASGGVPVLHGGRAADAAGEIASQAHCQRHASCCSRGWKKDEAGDQALLETSSTLRGRSGRAALEMKAIEANMQTLRSLHGNKKMMTMEPLGAETERKKDTTSNSPELDATAGRGDDLELQGALVTDLNSTTKNSDELSKRKEGIEEAMNDASVEQRPTSFSYDKCSKC